MKNKLTAMAVLFLLGNFQWAYVPDTTTTTHAPAPVPNVPNHIDQPFASNNTGPVHGDLPPQHNQAIGMEVMPGLYLEPVGAHVPPSPPRHDEL